MMEPEQIMAFRLGISATQLQSERISLWPKSIYSTSSQYLSLDTVLLVTL